MLIPNRSNSNTTAVESRSRLERSSVIEPESISFLLSFSPCQPRGARQVPFSIMSVTCCSGHSTHGAISYSEMLFSVCSMRIVSRVHWCGRRIVHRRGFLWVTELTHLHGDNAQSDLARKKLRENCGSIENGILGALCFIRTSLQVFFLYLLYHRCSFVRCRLLIEFD